MRGERIESAGSSCERSSASLRASIARAPFYYAWPNELALLDRRGKPDERMPVRWDMRKWLPGRFSEEAVVKFKAAPGDYRLALGLIDPWTKQPAIAWANDLAREDGWTVLSKVKVRGK